ncbi:MAG: hypothetical protein CMK92_06880 [Pseudomonas sp.]|nr:hypothetical protein [Pseudomonas sp.]|tara:strand:- start:13 stop:1233 length:1221 start_codon:yes stop_codon:yes gene_type:complete
MENIYFEFKKRGLNRSRELDLESLKRYLIDRLNSGDDNVFDDIVSINTYLMGYESTIEWIDQYVNQVSHNKLIFNKLKVMGQFNHLTAEEDLLRQEIDNGRINPVVFHRYLSVKLRLSQIESAIGFLSEYSTLMIEQDKHKIIFDWAIRLQAWKLFVTFLRDETFKKALFEKLAHSEKNLCLKLLKDMTVTGVKLLDLTTYCVSLESDHARYRSTKAIFGKYIKNNKFIRHIGVLGSQVPKVLTNKMCDESLQDAASIIGCTLSHLRIYEDMLKKKINCALVIEDDALPSFPLSTVLSEIDMSKFDILYLNDKNCVGWEQRDHQFNILPASDTLMRHGTYGYLITAKGANRILDYYSRDGIYKPIDGQLKDYSINETLRAFCLNTPVISHFDGGFSRRLLIDIGDR